jgi:cytochrome c-type biogenesis protein CcmF
VDRLGTFALALSLAVSVYGIAASVIGARRDRPLLVESARTSAYSLFLLVLAANLVMEAAILANDFSLRYVFENSSRETPVFFKVLALWSNDEGSLLLWNLILSGYIAAIAFRFRKRRPETLPWVLAVMYVVQVFYLMLVLGPTRPFAAFAVAPPDGRGPLPLLQNHPLMAVHPPFLYLGFIGFSVPFAFAMAALITGRLSDAWIRVTRRWTLSAWIFLTTGLLLGALWSYGVLGWGGYWAWDPVENVALLPWLLATALLHSVMLQERRGMLKVWNLALAVGGFALTTFGTFLTRGSILSSVHTFAQSAVGPMYLAFLVLVLLVGFGLIALRAWRLRTEGRFDSVLSREAAFMGNNLGLLVLTLVVLLGTIFPLFVEATTNKQVTVGGPYFVETSTPVFLLLLFLMGVGPLLSWRRTSADRLRTRLAVPALAAGGLMVLLAALGMRNVVVLLTLGLAVFVLVANVQEVVRGIRAHARATGRGAMASVLPAAGRDRRRFGGYVAHVGFAIAAMAIVVSSSFAHRMDVTLSQGQAVAFSGYSLRYLGERVDRQPQRVVLIADLSVARDGRSEGGVHPSLNLYPAASEPIGTPSIKYGVLKDLYTSVVSFEGDGRTATFRLFLNPGVMWLWVGGGVMVLGGLLSVWPARRERTAPLPPLPERELAGVG